MWNSTILHLVLFLSIKTVSLMKNRNRNKTGTRQGKGRDKIREGEGKKGGIREAFKKKTVKRVTLSLLGLQPTYPT